MRASTRKACCAHIYVLTCDRLVSTVLNTGGPHGGPRAGVSIGKPQCGSKVDKPQRALPCSVSCPHPMCQPHSRCVQSRISEPERARQSVEREKKKYSKAEKKAMNEERNDMLILGRESEQASLQTGRL